MMVINPTSSSFACALHEAPQNLRVGAKCEHFTTEAPFWRTHLLVLHNTSMTFNRCQSPRDVEMHPSDRMNSRMHSVSRVWAHGTWDACHWWRPRRSCRYSLGVLCAEYHESDRAPFGCPSCLCSTFRVDEQELGVAIRLNYRTKSLWKNMHSRRKHTSVAINTNPPAIKRVLVSCEPRLLNATMLRTF